jgi:hypothetical protein
MSQPQLASEVQCRNRVFTTLRGPVPVPAAMSLEPAYAPGTRIRCHFYPTVQGIALSGGLRRPDSNAALSVFPAVTILRSTISSPKPRPDGYLTSS